MLKQHLRHEHPPATLLLLLPLLRRRQMICRQ
jgi:hypothetical protein